MFMYCGLTNISIPNSVNYIWSSSFFGCGNLANVTLPTNVTSIGSGAFGYCSRLTTVYIPKSVTNLASYAFEYCTSLNSLYFEGDEPTLLGPNVLYNDTNTTAYYLIGTAGWSAMFADHPAVLWNPTPLTFGPDWGVQANRFGFNINGYSGANALSFVVEACTNLSNPIWQPLQTNTGSMYFSDPQWTNYPGRYYHLRSP